MLIFIGTPRAAMATLKLLITAFDWLRGTGLRHRHTMSREGHSQHVFLTFVDVGELISAVLVTHERIGFILYHFV